MLRTLAVACFTAGMCTAGLLAQTAKTNTTSSSSGPSAWVYVSSTIGTTSKNDVYGYQAAANGTLTRLPGSPYTADVNSLAVNGKYLFGAGNGSTYIFSYAMESDGALSYRSQLNSQKQYNCDNYPGPVFLDHTGSTLYNFAYWSDSECANNVYQSYAVVKSSGALTLLGSTAGSQYLSGPMTISSNNEYAYNADCYHFTPTISGFKRNSNGSLAALNYDFPFPTTSSGGWCPYLAVADPAMHLAVAMAPMSDYGDQSGPYQIATYTIESNGNLATSSTAGNMPKTAVGNVTFLRMAPSGKLLAIAGSKGLQIFHYNGASPATAYTGLLVSSQVDEMFWDNHNHLYAIGNAANKLWVFTITPTSHALVATYTVKKPVGMIVQPLPLP